MKKVFFIFLFIFLSVSAQANDSRFSKCIQYCELMYSGKWHSKSTPRGACSYGCSDSIVREKKEVDQRCTEKYASFGENKSACLMGSFQY